MFQVLIKVFLFHKFLRKILKQALSWHKNDSFLILLNVLFLSKKVLKVMRNIKREKFDFFSITLLWPKLQLKLGIFSIIHVLSNCVIQKYYRTFREVRITLRKYSYEFFLFFSCQNFFKIINRFTFFLLLFSVVDTEDELRVYFENFFEGLEVGFNFFLEDFEFSQSLQKLESSKVLKALFWALIKEFLYNFQVC